MKNLTEDKQNYLDKGLALFLRKYRYELIASFSLLALMLGITVGTIFFKIRDSKVVVGTTNKSTSSTEAKEIYVDIAGAVKTPGMYSFKLSKARVKDAIEKAGGLTDTADLTWINRYINMAETLSDGQKIYIPDVKGSKKTNDTTSETVEEKININHATKAQLKTLPGIGDTYAQRIIDNRPYQKPSDLLKVSGIGTKKYNSIKDLISAP